jgi:hypothetical protein
MSPLNTNISIINILVKQSQIGINYLLSSQLISVDRYMSNMDKSRGISFLLQTTEWYLNK